LGRRLNTSLNGSLAESRISRWRAGLAKGLAIDAGQRSSCWRSATAAGGTETGWFNEHNQGAKSPSETVTQRNAMLLTEIPHGCGREE